METVVKFETKEPIAYLKNEETTISIAVYSKFSLFKRFMIKWCFGLKYIKIK